MEEAVNIFFKVQRLGRLDEAANFYFKVRGGG